MKPELQYFNINRANPKETIMMQSAPSVSRPSFAIQVKPFNVGAAPSKSPALPKFKAPQISNHQHAKNPALAFNLLQEIEKTVADWLRELQQIQRQIQDIYLEGPIIDGWLESHPRQPQAEGVVTPQNQDEHLLDYVEEITDTGVSLQSPRAGYRLCGLDAHGKLWSRPCPAAQVADVSVAIARYQKLRQLLIRKQDREYRLNHLSEALVIMHSSLNL